MISTMVETYIPQYDEYEDMEVQDEELLRSRWDASLLFPLAVMQENYNLNYEDVSLISTTLINDLDRAITHVKEHYSFDDFIEGEDKFYFTLDGKLTRKPIAILKFYTNEIPLKRYDVTVELSTDVGKFKFKETAIVEKDKLMDYVEESKQTIVKKFNFEVDDFQIEKSDAYLN